MKYFIVVCIINLLLFLFLNYNNLIFNQNIHFNKIYKLSLVISAIIVAYSTQPSELDDLFRYFQHINNLKLYGINYLAQYPYKFNLIISMLFFVIYIIGNVHFLPAFVIIIYMLAIILLIKKGDVSKNSNAFSLVMIVLFSFEYFNTIISSVRFPLATAIFIMILLYDDKRDYTYNLLYITPILIHSSYILIIGLLALTKIASKHHINIKKVTMVIPYILICISFVFPNNVPFLSEIFERLQIYINPSFSLQYIDLRLLTCNIILFIIIIYILKSIKFEDSYLTQQNLYINMYINLAYLLIGLLPFFSIFSRFFGVFLLLTIPLINFFNLIEKKKLRIIIFVIIFISVGVLCYRFVNAIHYWRFMFF